MNSASLRRIAGVGLVVGPVFGIAGSLVVSPSLRGMLWGIDGTALVVATALLTIYYARGGNELAAGGFLVFALGQTLVVSSAAMDLTASAPSFGAGTALWAAGLALVSATGLMPLLIRSTGFVSAALFAASAWLIFTGRPLTPLSQPLPTFAFPVFAITLLGWAWVHFRRARP
jgi:hypothetical protein